MTTHFPDDDSIIPEWDGLPLVSTDHALEKMMELSMRLYDVAILLEYAEPCGDKRKKGTYELCDKWKGKDIKIVFTKKYSGWVDNIAWIIITIIEKR
ncbi:MAG: hypothetical protein CIT03_07460 [Methanobacterium sp.]|nr:MAG: hypothetical protein CIT03_07460 [Methanobacterium sp.]